MITVTTGKTFDITVSLMSQVTDRSVTEPVATNFFNKCASNRKLMDAARLKAMQVNNKVNVHSRDNNKNEESNNHPTHHINWDLNDVPPLSPDEDKTARFTRLAVSPKTHNGVICKSMTMDHRRIPSGHVGSNLNDRFFVDALPNLNTILEPDGDILLPATPDFVQGVVCNFKTLSSTCLVFPLNLEESICKVALVKSDALLEEWDKTNKRKDLELLSCDSLDSFRSSLAAKETNNKPLDVESVVGTCNALAKICDKNCKETKDMFHMSLEKKRNVDEKENEFAFDSLNPQIGETAVV